MDSRGRVIKHAMAEYVWELERGEQLCSAVGFVNCELAQRGLPKLTRDEQTSLFAGHFGSVASPHEAQILAGTCG